MRRMASVLAALVVLIGGLIAGPGARAAADVDLELVLLADASRSIDDGEIRLQRQGYAAAITHRDILVAIVSGYRRRIAVTYVEWGQADSQDVVVPWTVIDGKASAAAFAAALMAAPRRAEGPNAIGSALAFAQALIETNAITSPRQVIDFSGDSAYSFGGVAVAAARAAALSAGTVINGLAILCRDCESGRPVDYDLEAAFAQLITGGPGSFVITADGNARFAAAVRRKLKLEIAGGAPSHVIASEARQSRSAGLGPNEIAAALRASR